MKRGHYPLTGVKVAHIKYLTGILGLSQTQTAIMLELNVGTVSHVVNGHRGHGIPPEPPPGFDDQK
jgi:hypothetical protein